MKLNQIITKKNNEVRFKQVSERKKFIGNMCKGFSSPLTSKNKLQNIIFGGF